MFLQRRGSLTRSQSEIVRTEQTDFAGQYDYVFVFKMLKYDSNPGVLEQSDSAKHCIHRMLEAGLEVFPYLSVQQDELMVLVRCSVRNYLHHFICKNYFIILIHYFTIIFPKG